MILALCPMKIESDALIAHLGQLEKVSHHHGVKVSHFADLACATGGLGKVHFALTAQMLIGELKPKLLVCVGACGSLNPEVRTLDVVVAETTVEHDFTQRFFPGPYPSFPADQQTLERLKGVKVDFSMHFGKMASGDEDIVDPIRAAEIQKKTDALAVAWEGAGGGRAAAFCQTPYLELRVVTDSADENALQHFKQNTYLGMKNIAELLQQLGDRQ